MNELQRRFQEAGTVFNRRDDGRVSVADWPKPRTGNPTFLQDELARWQAGRFENQ